MADDKITNTNTEHSSSEEGESLSSFRLRSNTETTFLTENSSIGGAPSSIGEPVSMTDFAFVDISGVEDGGAGVDDSSRLRRNSRSESENGSLGGRSNGRRSLSSFGSRFSNQYRSQEDINSHANTNIAVFNESHNKPDGKTNYFLDINSTDNSIRVLVVIPFFNEEKKELQRTLESIYEQELEMEHLRSSLDEGHEFDRLEFYYIAIMDGYYKASDTMINYVSEMYGYGWDSDFLLGDKDDCTKILQKRHPDGTVDRVTVGENKTLNLTMVVKKQNRKKTNSHEWFFRAFCEQYDADYAFTTDCGTLYQKKCIHDMLHYLHDHDDVAAVTGRQRVMSTEMQNLRSEGLLPMWYRAAQAYDYEASISAFQGAFSICGMLPVLPGPCGMYKMNDIRGAALDYYMHFINNTTPDDGLLAGNLLLAEDRILSYAAALLTGKYTRWVPSAVFYFEAETESEKFLAQRRRWTNGTFCCYIYLLFMVPGIIWNAPKHSPFFKLAIYIQIFFQAALYVITALAPGIFITLCYYSVINLGLFGDDSKHIGYGVLAIYGVLYTTFCIGHYFIKFLGNLYNLILGWNTFMYIVVLGVIFTTFLNQSAAAIALVVLSLFFPFILAFLHSWDVFIMMAFHFLPFFLFLPTFIPWFMAYSFSRTWDLSWGNRPSDLKAERQITERNLKIKSFILLLLVMISNYALVFGFVWIDDMSTLLYISMGIISVSLIQQILSFFYYLFYAEHTTSPFFDRFTKTQMKIISMFAFAVTISLLYAGTFTTHWLTTRIDNVYRPESAVNFLVNSTHTDGQSKVNNRTDFYKTNPTWGQGITTTFSELNSTDYAYQEIVYWNITNFTKYGLNLVWLMSNESTITPQSVFTTQIKSGDVPEFSDYYLNITTVDMYKQQVGGNVESLGKLESSLVYYKGGDTAHADIRVYTASYFEPVPYDIIRDPIKGIPGNDTLANADQYPATVVLTNVTNYTVNMFSEVDMGYLNLYYGILFIQYQWETDYYQDETTVWGSNILWNTPNRTWAFTLLLCLAACAMLMMNFISILYSFCAKEKSRIYSITVIYTWLGTSGLFVCVLMFPFAWNNLNTYQVGWWSDVNAQLPSFNYTQLNGTVISEINVTQSSIHDMCGNSTGYWNPGSCSVGYSYILVIISLVCSLLSYSTLRYTLDRKYKIYQDNDKENTYKLFKDDDHDMEMLKYEKKAEEKKASKSSNGGFMMSLMPWKKKSSNEDELLLKDSDAHIDNGSYDNDSIFEYPETKSVAESEAISVL